MVKRFCHLNCPVILFLISYRANPCCFQLTGTSSLYDSPQPSRRLSVWSTTDMGVTGLRAGVSAKPQDLELLPKRRKGREPWDKI